MAGAALFLAVFLAALRTACPTVAFDDTGEACLAALTLGVPHPPGYPVFTMLTSLWAWIPLGSVAFRLNIFSAFLTASAAVLALSVFRRMGGKSIFTGIGVALLAVLFPASWSQAGLGKGAVYSLNLCLTLGVFRELWGGSASPASPTGLAGETGPLRPVRAGEISPKADETSRGGDRGTRRAISASLLFGLGLAHHWMSMVALAPVLAWMVLGEEDAGRVRRILLSAAAFVAGAGAYLFLVIRATAGPFLNWADPRSLINLLFVLSRRQYLSFLPGEEAMTAGEKLSALAKTVDGAVPWAALLALSAVGCVLLFRRSRISLAVTLVLPLAVFAGLAGFVPVRPGAAWFLETYSIPAVSLLVIIAGLGLEEVASLAGPRKSLFAAPAVMLAFLAWTLPGNWKANNRSRDYFTWDLAENLSGHGGAPALLFGSSDAVIFGNWYAWQVEERTQMVAVPVPLLPMPWVANGFANAVSGLRAPVPGPRVGAESVPALLRAWADANQIFTQWSFLTEPARAAFGRGRMAADGWMYRIGPAGKNTPAAGPVNRLRHLRLRGVFTPRLSADPRQDASIRPLVFSGLLTWGRGAMERDSRLARRAFRLAGMLGEGTPDQALCSLEMGNLEAFNQRFKEAEGFYRLALQQDPVLTVASRNLAMLMLSRQKVREAVELMKKIIKEAPESEESRELAPILRQLEKNGLKGA